MKIFCMFCIAVSLWGCAIANTTHLPSGEQGYNISCPGALSSWGKCFEKAGELCGSMGYEVITKNGEQGVVIGGGQSGFFGGTTHNRSMLIRCGTGLVNKDERQKPKTGQQEQQISEGTGWVVARGYIATNNHVIHGANKVFLLAGNGEKIGAIVVARDPVNDLAILAVDATRITAPAIPLAKDQAELASRVFTIGYPNLEVMGVAPKVTDGLVSSQMGASIGGHDDPRLYQVSVPVQPGNSGGPLLNMYGEVAGIITYKLDLAKAVQTAGALPENVNYAVKIQYLEPLLKTIPDAIVAKGSGLKREHTLEELTKKFKESVFIVKAYESQYVDKKSGEPDRSSIPQWMRGKNRQNTGEGERDKNETKIEASEKKRNFSCCSTKRTSLSCSFKRSRTKV